MGEFRIGRKFASHSYPESRFTGLVGPFARNYAVGPGSVPDVIAAGTPIPWSAIESGAPPGVNVPITPLSTGIVRVIAVVSLKSSAVTPTDIQVQVQANGIPSNFPFLEKVTVDANGFLAVPILSEGVGLSIGSTVNISILVTASSGADGDVSIVFESSSIEVLEMPVATG